MGRLVGWLQHAAAAVAVNVETSAKVNGFFFLFLSLLWFFGYDHPLKKQQLLVFLGLCFVTTIFNKKKNDIGKTKDLSNKRDLLIA